MSGFRLLLVAMVYLGTAVIVGAAVDIWRIDQTWKQMAAYDQRLAELKASRGHP